MAFLGEHCLFGAATTGVGNRLCAANHPTRVVFKQIQQQQKWDHSGLNLLHYSPTSQMGTAK